MNGEKSTGNIVKIFGEVIMSNISDQHRSWDHTLPIFCDVATTWELQQYSSHLLTDLFSLSHNLLTFYYINFQC